MIETSAFKILDDALETIKKPYPSGKGQTFKRCPTYCIKLYCHIFYVFAQK